MHNYCQSQAVRSPNNKRGCRILNKALSSKKGALKILELLTSKKKEKEEIEKKKEELIETFNKARNDNDKILIQH